MIRARETFETRARRYRGNVVAWSVWRIPAEPRSPRTRYVDEPSAVADFYGQDAQGRATQYAKQLSGEK